jgi:hypothetical protein
MTPEQQQAVNQFRLHVNRLADLMSWSQTWNGCNISEMRQLLAKFDEAAFIADLTALRAALECGDSLSHNSEDVA